MGSSRFSSDLIQSILATWAYSGVFGIFPSNRITTRWLLSSQKYASAEVFQGIQNLKKVLHIVPPKQKISTQKNILRDQIDSLQQAVSMFEYIPWIQAVWLTGSMAAENSQRDDDIDFLVLTASKRLWLTRFVVLVMSALLGRWRPRLAPTSKKTRHTWCWNIWLEPSAGLDHVPQSIYGAREIVQARLIFRRSDVSPTFLLDHACWARDFTLAGFLWARHVSRRILPSLPHKRNWFSPLFDVINDLAFKLQFLYMKTHQTKEFVQQNQAWFHPGDFAQYVATRYETMLSYWTQRMHTSTDFHWPQDWTEAERAQILHTQSQIRSAQDAGKRLVLATGVFDLLHAEHQEFLRKAAAAGDMLVVGVETDARVRASKGSDRPHQDQQTRLAQVAQVPGVTHAFLLPESFAKPEHHRALLACLLPAILAVSSHSPFQDRKAALLAEFGGRLEVVHEHNPAVSTTQLLAGIIKKRK